MAESGSATGPTESTHKKRNGRRTARACDECRMRKSKCDGLQPCEACRSTDRYCTYNLSPGRSTGSGTRIRILEDRLRRARAYLVEAQSRTPSLAQVDFDSLLGPAEDFEQSQPKTDHGSEQDDKDREKLESMMDSYGQMTKNTNGPMQRDFYGAASGLAWIKKTRTYLEDSDTTDSLGNSDGDTNNSATVQIFDAPLPPKRALKVDDSVSQLLPPRQTATKLLQLVFTQVYPMFHFLCEKEFQKSTDRIYRTDPRQYQEQDQLFLPLFYLVISLGYLFSKEEHHKQGCKGSIAQSMRHFIAGRTMLDIAHLRTVVSLQSILCLVLFLISTARMASAHAFLGAACASALRQGMHFRSTHESKFPGNEKRIRRRVFWAVMNLDMYVSGVLGLPPFMKLTEVDPAIDLTIEAAMSEVKNDPELTSADKLVLAASAKHIELMRIVFKAQQTLFPKPVDPPNSKQLDGTICVSVSRLQQVEDQYNNWARSLADILSHPDDSIEIQAIKYEMQICYYFAQIVLYRAFLHFLAKQYEDESTAENQLPYARTCVRMATKVIEVSVEHQRKGLLCPASWPSIYTVFISVVCLVFALATRKDHTTAPRFEEDIENGIRLLACTACTTDTGSVRCLEILRRLIKRVSYAVDVDVDEICARTSPLCSIVFSPRVPQGSAMDIDSLYSPAVRNGQFGSETSRTSSRAMVNNYGPQWSLSPDSTMTRPSLTKVTFDTQDGESKAPHAQEETMEIPYGGTFSWPEHDFHTTALRMRQAEEPMNYPANGHSRQGTDHSSTPSRLSSTDIAAFMHINAVDEPFHNARQWRS